MRGTEHAIVVTSCGWNTPLGAGDLRGICERLAESSDASSSQLTSQRIPETSFHDFADLPPECAKEGLVQGSARALQIALKGSRLEDSALRRERVGMVLGCMLAGVGGMIDFADDVRTQSPRFVSPLRFPQTVGNYLAGALARSFNLRGPNLTIATSDPSCGLSALTEAISILCSRSVDLVFAGGVNCAPRSLAESFSSSEPFSVDGACLFALEREESARSRTVAILGYVRTERSRGNSSNPELKSAFHAPRPGEIQVEHWVGSCGAALGAAAVAAGLAALQGLTVPLYVAPNQICATCMIPAPARVTVTGDSDESLQLSLRSESLEDEDQSTGELP